MDRRNTLVVTEGLVDELLRWDYPGEERIKYGLLGVSEGARERRFLLRSAVTPPLEEYASRGPASASTRASFVYRVYAQAWERGLPALAFAHTHPDGAFFSGTDRADARRHREVVFDFARYYLQIVVGREGLVGLVHFPDGTEEPLDRVLVLRTRGLEVRATGNGRWREQADLDRERHRRTLEVGGDVERALRLIADLRWGLIGVGGGGAAFLNSFKFLGPRALVLVDPDTLEPSNANRFMGYRAGDDGRPKVAVIERELHAFDPAIEVTTVQEAFPSPATEAALKDCDILVTVPDHHWARLQAAEFAARHLQPLFEGGAGVYVNEAGAPYRISCSTRLQLPAPVGPCLRCLGVQAHLPPRYEAIVEKARASYITGSRASLPTPASVVTLLGQLGTLLTRQVLYYLAALGGAEASFPRHLVWDEIPLALQDLSPLWRRSPDCPICGEGAPWGYGDAAPRLPAPGDWPGAGAVPPETRPQAQATVSGDAEPARQEG
jgi:molybdopterin/thiamine biosynthesis adenylyltransferase